MTVILKIENLSKHFKGVKAVDEVTLGIEEGKVHGLIGPNGAGKTTFFNLITQFHKNTKGKIFFKGERIDKLKTNEIVRKGIGRTFQIPRIFGDMKVIESMMIPCTWKYDSMEELKNSAEYWLKEFGIYEHRNQPAEDLSGGQKRILQIARVSMFEPELYLVDEPFSRMRGENKEKTKEELSKLAKEKGKTVMVVSHDVGSLMDIAERVMAMALGEIIAEGSPEEIRNNEKVIESYLGG